MARIVITVLSPTSPHKRCIFPRSFQCSPCLSPYRRCEPWS
jgi:hypothetical protein